MDLFEYQGKQYLASYGVPTSNGFIASNLQEVLDTMTELKYPVVVKAQVQVGGRGKAGGIKIANTDSELSEAASSILGMDIKGHRVDQVWIEPASEIDKEYYLSFTLDRSERQYLMMVSSEGGVEIETVAEANPGAIVKAHIDPAENNQSEVISRAIRSAGLDEPDQVIEVAEKLFEAFVKGDADLVEVNPLILTKEGKIHALDAKVTLDNNASYRHEQWKPFFETEVLDARERFAKERGLNYIGLDGTVGIIGNGAGLVMSTLDVVNQVGGSAANFLDVGGGAGADLLANAIEVVNSDEKVQAILINIFGGITRCDDVAEGIIDALSRVDVRSGIVVRLDGTNSEEGKALLSKHESEKLMFAPTMIEAAQKAVAIAGGSK